ncbi:MAG: GNAT family N-acetyltransferase [Ignisphaera sp.]
MKIVECGIECLDTVKAILVKNMGWYQAYFAAACLELGRCRALVALVNNVEVGSLLFYEAKLSPSNLVVIYYVAVEEMYRGRGIGKALVSSAEYISDGSMYIATTHRDNVASRKMFKDLDYSEIPFEHLKESTIDFLERLACSYEDDIVLYKGHLELDYLASLSLNRVVAKQLWKELCFNPWKRIRHKH